jgi:hypothetical protein
MLNLFQLNKKIKMLFNKGRGRSAKGQAAAKPTELTHVADFFR